MHNIALTAAPDAAAAAAAASLNMCAAAVADPTREIAVAYGMIDPELKDEEGLPLTCRSVFIVGECKLVLLAVLPPLPMAQYY